MRWVPDDRIGDERLGSGSHYSRPRISRHDSDSTRCLADHYKRIRLYRRHVAVWSIGCCTALGSDGRAPSRVALHRRRRGMNRKAKSRAFFLVLRVLAVLISSATIAAAQGIPAPRANQAFLYEMDEQAVLFNRDRHLLIPDPTQTSPTGLVDATNGSVGIPAIRHATSQLQGVAALGSVLCPIPLFVTVRGTECTIIATGTDDVRLAIDPHTGYVVPTTGRVWG